MSDGYQVTMSDLLAAANTFRSEGQAFGALMPQAGLAPADGGSPAVNDALRQVLESIGLLHAELAGNIGDDAASLAATHREYQWAEDKSTTVARGVTVDPSTIRP
ncbi:MAG: DUF6317 family protein [Streptosporangiales bacterium]|jgi:hypothetical protein|nr:DUF6317 family protein [Streptosporangiales bacterium]